MSKKIVKYLDLKGKEEMEYDLKEVIVSLEKLCLVCFVYDIWGKVIVELFVF